MTQRYYQKKSLSYEDQADRAINRGLVADREYLIEKLKCVSYYRLSGYWYPFRKNDPNEPKSKLDDFTENTNFELIWQRYRFDRKLRFLMLDAIERIEIALRSKLVYHFTQKKGPFAHTKKELFPNWKEHGKTIKKLECQAGFKSSGKKMRINKKRDPFIENFRDKYRNAHLPFWMFAELMDFGSITRFIEHVDEKQKIAKDFGLPIKVLLSWMTSLNSLRNACAHHARIWNKVWGTKPQLPDYGHNPDWYSIYSDADSEWHIPTQKQYQQDKENNINNINCAFEQGKTASLIAICRYFQRKIIPISEWDTRINALFSEFSGSNIRPIDLGLPDHWQEHPIWK